MQVLVLVDIQNDYFPGGRFVLPGMERAVVHAARLLEDFRRSSRPVVHVQHVEEDAQAAFFAPGSRGCEIHQSAAPRAGEKIVVKHAPNSFLGTSLESELRSIGAKELVICGAMSNMCIDATVRAAADLGFACTVVEDACAAAELEFQGRTVPADDVHAAFMAALGSAYARVLRREEWERG